MKIKTKTLPYEQVMALPRPAYQEPKRPSLFFRTLVRAAAAGDLKDAAFSFRTERMEELGEGPYLILMNHSSFIDLEIVSRVMYPKPYCIVCTSDGFVGKERLMRQIGCIPTNKFVTDASLIADIDCALKKGCSVLLYPEASYSFDGTATPLPRGLGVMLKRLKVPVVMIRTEGAFSRDPLYNCLQKRKVSVSAVVRGLLTPEEIRERSNAGLEALLDEMFSFDGFRWQQENHVEISEPFRADGLERILYKCPHCGAEGQTEGRGTELVCHACGRKYELDPFGFLRAADGGEPAFTHVPDWYAWERQEVRRELEEGSYLLDTEVEIGMLVDFKAIYMVGEGRLRHDLSGFTLDGCGGKLHFERPAAQCYSLYADYYWYELGDIICIGDRDAQYYCFPKTKLPVAKARLATEELYKMIRARKRARNLKNP